MATEVLQMYAAVTGGTQNALAAMDIPEDGSIDAVTWAINADLDTDADEVNVELSFLATGQIATNDARGVISGASVAMQLVTSGMSVVGINFNDSFVPGLKVAGGERIYINALSSATTTADVRALIHFNSGSPRAPRRAARRTTR